MKLEKINDNKVKITLSLEELESREVTLKDIQTNSNIAKDLFRDLIEENNLDEDFILNESHLFIEASSDNNNSFSVTITKVDNLPDYTNYQSEKEYLTKNKSQKKSKSKTTNEVRYTVDSYIYTFEKLDYILNLCEKSKTEKLFFGKNSLYKYNDEYFLIFSKTSIKNPKFIKTYVFLSEYCKTYYSYELFETSIKERAKLIIQNNALQKLSKI